jgi:hypothetical protein
VPSLVGLAMGLPIVIGAHFRLLLRCQQIQGGGGTRLDNYSFGNASGDR